MDSHTLKSIPHGFIEIDHSWFFNESKIKKIEDHVLHTLVRDHYVFYRLELDPIPIGDEKAYRLFLICRPKDQFSIVYKFGIYVQTVLQNHDHDEFCGHQIHRVPDGFPDCIRVELEGKEK